MCGVGLLGGLGKPQGVRSGRRDREGEVSQAERAVIVSEEQGIVVTATGLLRVYGATSGRGSSCTVDWQKASGGPPTYQQKLKMGIQFRHPRDFNC